MISESKELKQRYDEVRGAVFELIALYTLKLADNPSIDTKDDAIRYVLVETAGVFDDMKPVQGETPYWLGTLLVNYLTSCEDWEQAVRTAKRELSEGGEQ